MNKLSRDILHNVKKTYNLIGEEFSKTRQNIWGEFVIFEKLIAKNTKIADIGCGNGRFFKFITKKLPKYTGIDNSKTLIKEAKKQFSKHKLKPRFLEGNILKIPLQTASQQVASCIAVLHHIPTTKLRKKAVAELARILKKEGKLLLTVWNLREQKKYKKNVVKAIWKWLYSFGKHEKRGLIIPWGKEKIPRYYYAFKEKELDRLLNPHFKILKKKKGKNLIYICEKK